MFSLKSSTQPVSSLAFRLLLLCNCILPLCSGTRCSSRLCNFAGACTLVDKTTTCRCIGKYFQGERCAELVDHCAATPCRNEATCTNAMGQYVCGACKEGFGGQQCTVRVPDTFTKMHVLLNPTGTYGIPYHLLLTVETLGSVSFIYEIFTANCLIDTFETKPKDSKAELRFKYSKNLIDEAKSLGLRHAGQLPYRSGYYHKSWVVFWEDGDIDVTARVADEEYRALYEQEFVVRIALPSNMPCAPTVGFAHGNNPQEPLMLDIARFNLFEAIVHRRCDQQSTINMHWTIHNSIGTVQLFDFGDTGKTQLKIRPYRLWFNFHGELMQSYMLKVRTLERYHGRDVYTESRVSGPETCDQSCYMFVMSKPVSAVILGGATREVGIIQSFVMDGSKSLDFALSPDAEQKMKCVWHCESQDDPDNKFCRRRLSYSNKVNIRAGVLKIGKTYTFSFLVRSNVNLFEEDRAQQVVKIVPAWQHSVAIYCARNCLRDKFSVDQKVHLRVKCDTCATGAPMQISWTREDGSNLGDKYRVAFMPPPDEQITVAVKVTSDDRSGQAFIKLLKNEPPSDGKCAIRPASGVEYETEFLIECSDFFDHDAPISFQYIADNFTLSRTNERLLSTRLPQTGSVKVIVCDFLFACTETKVSVSVTAMKAPADKAALIAFLAQDENNLAKLLKYGDIQRALVLADVLTRNAKALDLAQLVHRQFKHFKFETLLAVETLTKITNNLIEPLKPLDNKKVTLFADMFKQISDVFETVIDDGEVREILPDSYQGIIGEVTHMVTEFSEELESIPAVQSLTAGNEGSKDPLAENYMPLPDFDLTVLERVGNWLNVIEQSFKCFHYIGVAGTVLHEPNDESYKLEQPGMQMEVLSIEGSEKRAITTENQRVQINLTQPMLSDLGRQSKKNRILLQLITFEKSPFWWYPTENRLRTEVVYFSAFSAADVSQHETHLSHPFEFRMSLLPADGEGGATASPTEGVINSTLDMPIFSVDVPLNSVLILKFVRSSTRLRAMLQLNTKPRGYEVRRTADIVPAKDTYAVVNDQPRDTIAYLAVLAADDINTEHTFDFTTELKKCVSWDFKLRDPQWTSAGCIPKLEPNNTSSIVCRCYHLSVFGGKVHQTPAAETNTERQLLETVPVNRYLVLGYLLLLLMFVLIFVWACHRLRHHRGNLVADLDYDAHKEEDYEITAHFSTGGQWNAATSANIELTFVMQKGVQKFLIVQDPERPHLERNSMCTLRLPLSGDDLAYPLRLHISHDNAGRYPSWYCRSIVIEDKANEMISIFEVEDWITTEPLRLNAAHFDEAGPSRSSIFRQTLERAHTLWFQNQPLLGPWKYGEAALNGFERACIWAAKLAVSICVVANYYGSTNIETYEEERETFNNAIFDGGVILQLCILCYCASVIVELVIRLFIYRSEDQI